MAATSLSPLPERQTIITLSFGILGAIFITCAMAWALSMAHIIPSVLAKYSKADDYTLDDEATERITAWYTDAEKTIKEGTIVTESYIKLFKDNMSLFNFSPSNGKERFELFLKLLQEECDKKNADNAD